MGILHDALATLKADIGRAFDFADPGAFVADAEAKFKATVADTFHALEDRVKVLEDHLLPQIEAAVAAAAPVQDPAPAADAQAGDQAQNTAS